MTEYLLETTQNGLSALVDTPLDIIQRRHEAHSCWGFQLNIHLEIEKDYTTYIQNTLKNMKAPLGKITHGRTEVDDRGR